MRRIGRKSWLGRGFKVLQPFGFQAPFSDKLFAVFVGQLVGASVSGQEGVTAAADDVLGMFVERAELVRA
jgi:hypothetical protein